MNQLERELVIIGAGMAGTRLAQKLIERGFERSICLIGAEPEPGYNRILLTPVLSGEKSFDSTLLAEDNWYEMAGVELICASPVESVDLTAQALTLRRGTQISYEQLVFATGSDPFIIPLPGHTAEGVYAFRTHSDVGAMLERIDATEGRVAVIGGGLLGLEAASALARRGAKVTVIHNHHYLLERQLNSPAAALIQAHLERMGINFRLSAATQSISTSDDQVCGLEFENQPPLQVDAVVMATGVRPSTQVAKACGLKVNRGIVVDGQLNTSATGVYAVGECSEFEGDVFGMVAPVYDQVDVLAEQLCNKQGHFAPKALATKLKVTGVDLFSAGDISDDPAYEISEYHSPVDQIYRRLSFHEGRLVGAILIGDVADGGFLFELITGETQLSGIRHQIIFGRHYCDERALRQLGVAA